MGDPMFMIIKTAKIMIPNFFWKRPFLSAADRMETCSKSRSRMLTAAQFWCAAMSQKPGSNVLLSWYLLSPFRHSDRPICWPPDHVGNPVPVTKTQSVLLDAGDPLMFFGAGRRSTVFGRIFKPASGISSNGSPGMWWRRSEPMAEPQPKYEATNWLGLQASKAVAALEGSGNCKKKTLQCFLGAWAAMGVEFFRVTNPIIRPPSITPSCNKIATQNGLSRLRWTNAMAIEDLRKLFKSTSTIHKKYTYLNLNSHLNMDKTTNTF